MMEFETKVDVEMPYEQGVSYKGDATVKWSVEFEVRERGIKDIYIHIPDQTIQVIKVTETEEDDIEEDVELEVKDAQADLLAAGFPAIIPDSLEFYNGKWVLIFQGAL